MIKNLLSKVGISQWEKEFLESIDRYHSKNLSGKQEMKLRDINKKYTGGYK